MSTLVNWILGDLGDCARIAHMCGVGVSRADLQLATVCKLEITRDGVVQIAVFPDRELDPAELLELRAAVAGTWLVTEVIYADEEGDYRLLLRARLWWAPSTRATRSLPVIREGEGAPEIPASAGRMASALATGGILVIPRDDGSDLEDLEWRDEFTGLTWSLVEDASGPRTPWEARSDDGRLVAQAVMEDGEVLLAVGMYWEDAYRLRRLIRVSVGGRDES